MTMQHFFEMIRGKTVALAGLGVTNGPLIDLFLRKGAKVIVCDRKEASQLDDSVNELQSQGVSLNLGRNYLRDLNCDMIFRAPGIPYYLPELVEYREKGIPVTSEMEIFFEICPTKIYAVTGSDGKTTTSSIIAECLKKEGYHVYLGGNIGRNLLADVESMKASDRVVVELSSFQLISMRQSPDVAVLTNISPNHLDIHKDMEEYIEAKKNIFLHQNAFGKTILNADNIYLKGFSKETRGVCWEFSMRDSLDYGGYLDSSGCLQMNDGFRTTEILHKDEIFIRGSHNVENYLAASAAVWQDVSAENIKEVAKTFRGVEHRIEFIRTLRGVRYFNDSMATTPTRTIAALQAFDGNTVLIAGGYDKKIGFARLGEIINKKVKTLILMGVTADQIETAVKEDQNYAAEKIQIYRVHSLEEALSRAVQSAGSEGTILLSPACASFDMFKNYDVRGKLFKHLVNELN